MFKSKATNIKAENNAYNFTLNGAVRDVITKVEWNKLTTEKYEMIKSELQKTITVSETH